MFQNIVTTEVRWTEASSGLCVDLNLMVSILSSVHVEAILCYKGAACRKKPGDT